MFIDVNGKVIQVIVQHTQGQYTHNGKPLKGFTEVFIKDEDGNIISKGESYCSAQDNFVKRTGLNKALERALNKEIFNRDDRKVVWEKLFEQKTKTEKFVELKQVNTYSSYENIMLFLFVLIVGVLLCIYR